MPKFYGTSFASISLFRFITNLIFCKRHHCRIFECKSCARFFPSPFFLTGCKTCIVRSSWASAFSTTVERNRMYIYVLCKRPSTFVLFASAQCDTVCNNKSEFKSVIIECCTQNKPNLTLLFSSQQNKWHRLQSHCRIVHWRNEIVLKCNKNARIKKQLN